MRVSDFHTGWRQATVVAKKHQLLVLTIVALLATVGTTRFLRGDIMGGIAPGGRDLSDVSGIPESLRSCQSAGTIFETIENLEDLRDVYMREMSEVFHERENVFRNPSAWKCTEDAEGPSGIEKLESLASRMPGWRYYTGAPQPFGGVTGMRPVTFDAFGAVVAEFQREYECKLTELQDRVLLEVVRNQDLPRGTQFCCMVDGCGMVSDATACVGPVTTNPLCDNACDLNLVLSAHIFATRMGPYHRDLQTEREVSRIAVSRAIQTLRSFEINYAAARQLTCYRRASLDLRNEMGLLADTVSCMPKIWDAATSFHDPS